MKVLCFILLMIFCSMSFSDDIAFSGTMETAKELGVEMQISCEVIDRSEARIGSYQYRHIGKDIGLNGFIIGDEDSESGVIFMQEEHDDVVTGAFVLRWDKGIDEINRLSGYWTNFVKKYPVWLNPADVIHFREGPPYSSVDFTLTSRATSFAYSDLYLNFEGHQGIKVGSVPNCERDGRVDMAWLNFSEDGSFNLTIREEFWGSEPGDREYTYNFNSQGHPVD